MRRSGGWIGAVLVLATSFALTACDEMIETPAAATAKPAAVTVAAGSLTCPPAATPAANVSLAARVNGVGIPLERYNREVSMAQAALTAQSKTRSQVTAESLKSIRQQILDQLINDLVVNQQAEKEGIKISSGELDAELAKSIPEGGVAKLNEYLTKNRLSLADLCDQIRTQLNSAAMLNRVANTVPTQAEQVHVRQILVANQSLAQTLRERLRKGEDFGTLAKQNSIDASSKANGGDLGWVPKGVLDPRLETVAFGLAAGQVSDVVTTNYGFAIIQVTEKDASRPLTDAVIQSKRRAVFTTWLQAVRNGVKIERFVQP